MMTHTITRILARSLLVSALVSLAAGTASASEPSGPGPDGHHGHHGHGHHHGKPKPQVVLPPIQKPSATVQTYLKDVQRQQQRDPVLVTGQGYNRGSTITVSAEQEAKVFQAPDGQGKVSATAGKVSRAQVKKMKQARSQAARRALSEALQHRSIGVLTPTLDSPAQQFQHEFELSLAPHTPMKITAKDPFGRKYRTINTLAQGLRDQSWIGQPDGTQAHRHSEDIAPYQPWAKVESIGALEPQIVKGADGAEKSVVRLLGMGAFPNGATVTVVNRNNGASTTFTSGSYTDQKGRARSARGNKFEIHGEAGDRLEITVSYAAVPGLARPSDQTYYAEVPNRHNGDRMIVARDKTYRRLLAQPREISFDRAKFHLTTAYSPDGRAPGRVLMSFGEQAFSRGAVVKVTNMKLAAEGNAQATTTYHSSKEQGTLSILGHATDRLKVEVLYPGGDMKTFFTEVPKHSGKPSFVEHGENFYPAAAVN